MTEYSYQIITKRLSGGKSRSKINENGTPISIDLLQGVYRQIYDNVVNAHKQTIRTGRLEKITTEFKSKGRFAI